jgi:endonuclease G
MARNKGNQVPGKIILAFILIFLVWYFFQPKENETPQGTGREKKPPRTENKTTPKKRSPDQTGGNNRTGAPANGGFPFESEAGFGLPISGGNCELVKHQAYTICYGEEWEQPLWVAYQLTADNLRGTAERENDFRPDPDVSTGSATPDDYRGSGYDRGHLAPAADFKKSPDLMSESFFMSNMSPQAPDFNRGIWETLESRVRVWARRDKMLYIVTGPVLKKGLPTIGRRNQVAIPEQYYKVVLFLRYPEARAIAFLMRNEGSELALKSFVVSVDQVESVTGIDFFPQLPDDLENQLESKVETRGWFPGAGTTKEETQPAE